MASNKNEKAVAAVNKISKASSWEECGFIAELTQDGSYSLKILSSPDTLLVSSNAEREERNSNYILESMHHSGGALTETMYIYAPVAILTIGQFFLNNQKQSGDQARRIFQFSKELLLNTLSRAGVSEKDKDFFTAILSNEKFDKSQNQISKIFETLKQDYGNVRDFSEDTTTYLPIEDKKKFNQDLNINHHLVVGLGLGYIECVVACVSFLFQKQSFVLETPYKLSIESYEIVEELKIAFQKYLFDQSHFATPYYDKIFTQVLEFFSIDLENLPQIKKILSSALEMKNELNMKSLSELQTYSAIYFDAFSKKTSPDLWTPEFLEKIFSLSAKNSFFSTYACTGFLKRSLRSQGFTVEKRLGFKGKRDSTFALRFAVTD